MTETFKAFATTQDVTTDSPWLDIIDAAIDYLEAHVRPMPADENKTDDWFAWAHDRAAAIASAFTEEG